MTTRCKTRTWPSAVTPGRGQPLRVHHNWLSLVRVVSTLPGPDRPGRHKVLPDKRTRRIACACGTLPPWCLPSAGAAKAQPCAATRNTSWRGQVKVLAQDWWVAKQDNQVAWKTADAACCTRTAYLRGLARPWCPLRYPLQREPLQREPADTPAGAGRGDLPHGGHSAAGRTLVD